MAAPHHPTDPFAPPPSTGLSRADALEVAALARILHALATYRGPALAEVSRWEAAFAALPPAHAARLPHLPAKHAAARAAVAANGAFLDALVSAVVSGQAGLGPGMAPLISAAAAVAGAAVAAGVRPAPADVDKARYVLRNAARDWSVAGRGERGACYDRLVEALARELRPPPPAGGGGGGGGGGRTGGGGGAAAAAPPPARPRVLVPGAGLARLALDLTAAGFAVEANEHSYFMLLASAFLLNAGPGPGAPATIHPWALAPSNRATDADQMRGVAVPDVEPSALAAGGGPGGLAMVAGEFTAVYGRRRERGGGAAEALFDGVATAFFIDTAPNPLSYMDAIAAALKPGGVWVNCGPLLWHWAAEDGGGGGGASGAAAAAAQADGGDAGDGGGDGGDGGGDDPPPWPHSLELCLDDVLAAAAAAGFALLQPVSFVDAAFNADEGSMLRSTYRCAFWVMRKEERAVGGGGEA